MKISIVIPVYNVEACLRTTLDSVAEQTYGDWECICVDDGSTDGSSAILDERAAADPRFRVFHRSNSGVSAARNFGVTEARGDLIAYLDSDDTFHPQALAAFADVFARTGADLIRYDWRNVTCHTEDARDPLTEFPFQEIDFSGTDKSPLHEAKCGAFTVVTRHLASTVSWPALSHGEDPLYLLRCFRASVKIVRIRATLANYLARAESATRAITLGNYRSTCEYLAAAVDECAKFDSYLRTRDDTVAFVRMMLYLLLFRGWTRLPGVDADKAKNAYLHLLSVLSVRTDFFPLRERVRLQRALRTGSLFILWLLVVSPYRFGRSWHRRLERIRRRRKPCYDLVFGLGSSCSCTQCLRSVGLQFATLPLDWLRGGDVRSRTELILRGFEGWLSEERLEPIENPGAFGHDLYIDRVTGLQFYHDFEKGRPLPEMFPEVKTKYARRIARLLNLLGKSRRTLIVWLGDPRDERLDDAALLGCREAFARRYPQSAFDLLAFDCRASAAGRTELAEGVVKYSFDYRCHAPDAKEWQIDPAPVLRLLAGYHANDYRTRAERKAFLKEERRRKRNRRRDWREALLHADVRQLSWSRRIVRAFALVADAFKRWQDDLSASRDYRRWRALYARTLERIRQYPSSRKIRVLFFVDSTSKWKAQSLYEALERTSDFEPLIALSVSATDARADREGMVAKLDDDESFFRGLGDRCVRAYDPRTGRASPLAEFEPDVVFYQEPNVFFPEQVVWRTMERALCCYIPYSIEMLGEHREYQCANWFHQLMFARFALNAADAEFVRAAAPCRHCAGDVVASGHPVFDAYAPLTDGSRGTDGFVIYAPHFSFAVPGQRRFMVISSFLENGRRILDYAKVHPEMKWLFKPHPRLRAELEATGGWTKAEVDAYYAEWERLGVGYYSGDYLRLFEQSRAMITDCGSFCAEYPATGKPLIRLIPAAYDYPIRSAFAPLMASLYEVRGEREMLDAFAMVLERREDPKRAQRLAAVRAMGLEPGAAAKHIVDFLRQKCGRPAEVRR